MPRWWILAAALAAACSSDRTGPGLPPPVPTGLVSTSLDGAVALAWDDNAFTADPARFQNYRVFSTTFDIDADPPRCGTSWLLEGSTVAPEFLVGALENGRPRCFAVSAVSVDQAESARSEPRGDTPRPDARNVAVYATQVRNEASGFRFWDDLNRDGVAQPGELGLVRAGSDPGIDFRVEQDVPDSLRLTPVRPGTELTLYEPTGPVEDLTSIDLAPVSGYARASLRALPGWGYVFRVAEPDGFQRFAAVRLTHVGRTFLILDWSYQTDPLNPELRVGGTE